MKRVLSSTLIPLLLILALLTGCKGDANQRKKKFLEIGNKSYAKADYKAAAINYRRALQEDNKFAEAYYKLGLTYLMAGSPGDAVSNLQRAFTLAPENTDAASKLATIYAFFVVRDPKHARNYLTDIQDVSDRLLKRDPKSYDGLRLSGYLLVQNGRIDEAPARYQQANEVKPDQGEVILPWAMLLFNGHHDKEGERLLTDLIAKNKDNAEAYDMLYTLYTRDKRLDEADKVARAKADAIPDRPEYRLQLAYHYFINQRRADMEKELNTVSNSGKDGRGHMLVGDLFNDLKEYDRAQKEYETGVQQGGKNKAAFQVKLARLFATQQKFDDSSKLIDQVLKADSKNNEAAGMRAALQISSGDLAKIDLAIADLKTIVQRSPENFYAHFQLGRAYLAKAEKTNNKDQVPLGQTELETAIKQRADFALAKLLLAQLMVQKQEYGKAVALMDEVIASNPAIIEAHVVRAKAWAGQKEYAKARTALEGILKASPMQQDARFQLGEVYRVEGNYKAAEATFREFRKISPGDPRAWTGIANTLANAKRLKDLEAFLKDELAADPKNEGARLMLAQVYNADLQFDAAMEQYRILLKDHPRSSDIHAGMADTLGRKGDKKEAVDYFRKAVELKPDAPAPMLYLAMILQESDEVAEARVLYEKVLKLEPRNVSALNNLAFMKAEEGTDIDGALTMATKAMQSAQEQGVGPIVSDTISDTMGWIYIKKNLSDDAIRVFTDLCRKDPNSAMYRYHLAQALLQKGDKAGAKKELEEALNRIKAHPDAKYEKKIREFMPKVG